MDSRLPENSISDSHVPIRELKTHVNLSQKQKEDYSEIFPKCEK